MGEAVVVGGGICGILSALLLASRDEQVTLIEQSPRLGGLLNSFHNEDGLAFDYGTHFVLKTGIEEVDALLFKGIEAELEHWHQMQGLKGGNYFCGKLNGESACLDTRNLPAEVYQQGLVDLLHLEQSSKQPENLQQWLLQRYGKTFAENAFGPALTKLYGISLDELACIGQLHVVFPRLILGSSYVTEQLKHAPFFDDRIAYQNDLARPDITTFYYPKQGGVSRWVDLLSLQLEASGVKVLTNTQVNEIEHSDGQVTQVNTSNEKIACQKLVWTIPTFHCLKAARINFTSHPPVFRSTVLFHFVFDKPLHSDRHYISNYDPKHCHFRSTLYPNIGDNPSVPYQCTVEVFCEKGKSEDIQDATIISELQEMNIIDENTKILYQHRDTIEIGFPLVTKQFMQDAISLLQLAEQSLGNVVFAGKARCSSFFMKDVLTETHHLLSES